MQGGGVNEGRCACITVSMEDLVAQMRGDTAASRDPVREGPPFFVITQKVTDIDYVQADSS